MSNVRRRLEIRTNFSAFPENLQVWVLTSGCRLRIFAL
jgi:hypothetical protein